MYAKPCDIRKGVNGLCAKKKRNCWFFCRGKEEGAPKKFDGQSIYLLWDSLHNFLYNGDLQKSIT